MSKFVTHIFGLVLLLVMAIGVGSCEDNPVRPKGFQRPDCWKPLDSVAVPFTAADFGPAWSPSGRLVAYISRFDSCNDLRSAVYITDSTGRPKTPLSIFGSVVKWLPGDSLVIVNTGLFIGGELVMYNINTDSTIPLGVFTRSPLFDVSVDGRFIYYSGQPIDSTAVDGIYQYDLVRKISTPIVAGGHPSISFDGMTLALFKGPLYTFSLNDSTLTILSPEGDTPNWTPDGTRIVHTDGLGKLFVTDLAGNTTELIGRHDLRGAFGSLSVSPDGKSVLFKMLSEDDYTQLWQINLDGTGLRKFAR